MASESQGVENPRDSRDIDEDEDDEDFIFQSMFDDEGIATHTSREQKKLESTIYPIYDSFDSGYLLNRKNHIAFLKKGLKGLSSGYQSLDSSRPWLCYWILHSLNLLGAPIKPKYSKGIIHLLSLCQDKDGGFAGGIGQLPHILPTYAAINALAVCGVEEAYKLINRKGMYQFLMGRKHPSGGFIVHKDGEMDVRGAYCALSVASLLNIMTPELIKGTPEYIASCQSYEGGISAQPGSEAHGGYTFCGIAALILMGRGDILDLPRLINWAIWRQMQFEGGFQGRTNKLVDSCYSFWQGGVFPLIDILIENDKQNKKEKPSEDFPYPEDGSWLFEQQSLQKYILLCCQDESGGMKDKPGKARDYYHTCYALSGLSISQHNKDGSSTVLGNPSNLVELTHPVFNIHPTKVLSAISYFSKQPPINEL